MKKIITTIIGVLLFSAVICMTNNINADLIKKDQMELGGNPFVVKNSYGDTLIYTSPQERANGTMNLFGEETVSDMPYAYKKVLVESDKKYICTNIKGVISFNLNCESHDGFFIEGDKVTEVVLEKKLEGIYMKVTGHGGYVQCNISAAKSTFDTDIQFYLNGTVTIFDSGSEVKVSGLSGIANIFTGGYEETHYDQAEGVYYANGNDLVIKKTGTKLTVTNAQKMSTKTKEHKTLKNVRIKPVNNNKNMLLSWDGVKSAYKYKIYRYDYFKKKYISVAERKWTDYNYYDINNISTNTKYKYAVRAYSYDRIKRKYKALGKRVAVMAVSGDSVKGNVSKVKLKKKTIKAKVGKKIKIKYTLKVDGKKKPISKKLTWYTSNKKIATFKKGKLVLKKKGKCKIYAMAHNGVVSKTIKVKVKK